MKSFLELCESSKETHFDAFEITNFIDTNEHETCLEIFDTSPVFEDASHDRAIRKDSQMLPSYGPSELKEIFLPKLAKVFSDKKIVCVGSNYTEWKKPVGVHTDGYQLSYTPVDEIEQNQEVLGFALLVPLRTDTGKGHPATVFFDQKYFGPSINLKAQAHEKDSDAINDKSLIDGYTHTAFDKDHPEYHRIDYMSQEILHGFSINKVLEWNTLNAIVWHRAQFHCSSKFVDFNTKTHLIFFCNFV